LKNRAFSGVIDSETGQHAGYNTHKIPLYGQENCDYTDSRLPVFSSLPLSDWIKSPRLIASNLIQLLAK
jgi:hypothetical protein